MKLKASFILAAVLIAVAAAAFLFSPALTEGYKISPSGQDFLFEYPETAPFRSFTVFLGGDTENEGFYEVPAGITYSQLFSLAGFRQTAGYNLSAKVNPSVTILLSGDCCNINYSDYATLLAYTGDPEIARAIADFIRETGGTSNKYDLLTGGTLTQEQFNSVKNRIYAVIQ